MSRSAGLAFSIPRARSMAGSTSGSVLGVQVFHPKVLRGRFGKYLFLVRRLHPSDLGGLDPERICRKIQPMALISPGRKSWLVKVPKRLAKGNSGPQTRNQRYPECETAEKRLFSTRLGGFESLQVWPCLPAESAALSGFACERLLLWPMRAWH